MPRRDERRELTAARAAPLALAAALLLVAGCGGSETTTQPLLAPTAPEPPGVTAAPSLHHACAGEGSPTVVLEAGLGAPSEDWREVQGALSRLTRTCSYDRAGLGQSPAPDAAGARTAAVHVDELAALLRRAGIEPPYVLVGHSYGGMLARLFAHAHRDDVAGAVLVDSPHPDERERYLAALPRGDDDPVVARIRAQLRLLHDPAANPELVDWEASAAEVRAADDLGDLPLVVVTAGRAGPRRVAGLDPRLAGRLEDVRLELQRELAALSTDAVHVVAAESGHSVQDPETGQPAVVAAAVEAVVAAARREAPLPPCDEVFAQPGTRCVAPRR